MKRNRALVRIILVLSVILSGSTVFRADAASLVYTNATNISLASPSTTLTIAAGSVADGLTVNATNLVVTLSPATGGNFVITSPSYDLLVATSTGAGNVTITCTNGTDMATLFPGTGSAVYTVTPGGTNCISPQIGLTPTLVGGGGSSYNLAINDGMAITATTSIMLSLYGTAAYTMEVSNTSTFVGATWVPYAVKMPWTLDPALGSKTVYVKFKAVDGTIVGSAQASINLVSVTSSPSTSSRPSLSLTDQLKALQAQLAALMAQSSGTASSAPLVFARNLYFGITGNDVKALQQFLISENSGTAAQKLAVHGTTQNFGTLTINALIEFQKKVGIKPASGYFGPITRRYVNGLSQ